MAEDVAQESFLQAYRKLGDLRDGSRFAGWLSQIVRQRSVDCLQREGRPKGVSLEVMGEPAALTTNPGLTEEQRRWIRMAVGRLPEKFREVILMRFVGGMSTGEIARQLQQRPVTVRVKLHRAYKRLSRDLRPMMAR